jgi:hypothetical protein
MAEQRPLATISDAELEQALADLRRHLAFPATPDLAPVIRARLENDTLSRQTTAVPRARWRVAWLAAAALLILIAGTLLLVPQVRTAIADRLGLPGVQLEWLETPSAPPASPVGTGLQLGRQVTLAEGSATVDFPVLVPTLTGFDQPDEIYLSGWGEATMLSFVYLPAPNLPSSQQTGVGALLTEFRGSPERNLIMKGLHDDADGANRLQAVSVAGQSGFWISGVPHAFYVCPDRGECREVPYRLASNVLLWEQNGLTLRLESSLSLEESLAIASSVRALEPATPGT